MKQTFSATGYGQTREDAVAFADKQAVQYFGTMEGVKREHESGKIETDYGGQATAFTVEIEYVRFVKD